MHFSPRAPDHAALLTLSLYLARTLPPHLSCGLVLPSFMSHLPYTGTFKLANKPMGTVVKDRDCPHSAYIEVEAEVTSCPR